MLVQGGNMQFKLFGLGRWMRLVGCSLLGVGRKKKTKLELQKQGNEDKEQGIKAVVWMTIHVEYIKHVCDFQVCHCPGK